MNLYALGVLPRHNNQPVQRFQSL